MIKQITRQQRIDAITAQAQWDIIIIGGGITGAGIFKLASQLGLKTLLLEQKDFAWGSSSRSSKMVHGGLRYIAQGQIKLTKESVKERQRLLNEAPHLVKKQSFAMAHFKGQFPWPWIFNCLLRVYELFAKQPVNAHKQHHYLNNINFPYLVPNTNEKNSNGGTQFSDALTEDARLVLRQIQEAQNIGGHALNYCRVDRLLFDEQNKHRVIGVSALTEECTAAISLCAKIVINATGAWADKLALAIRSKNNSGNNKNSLAQPLKMRPLRGSHLIVPSWRLPVASVVSILHPVDKRPVQVYPWQNVTVIGTTDIEHDESLNVEAHISTEELDYLFAAVDVQFPNCKLTKEDIISTFSGVRPVIANDSKVSSSKEKRDHSIAQQDGLITVTGGKLTTFRMIAEQVLQLAATQLTINFNVDHSSIFEKATVNQKVLKQSAISGGVYQHLLGCYGQVTTEFLQQSACYQLKPISYSCHVWAELIWAVKYEQVQHLDDLLLRRTRLGNVLPNASECILEQVKILCQSLLSWSEQRWQDEVSRYQKIWHQYYSLPTITCLDAAKKPQVNEVVQRD